MLQQTDPHASGGGARGGRDSEQPRHPQRRRGCSNSRARAGQEPRHPRRPLVRRNRDNSRGTDDRVAGLVYIAALAPDEDETSQSQQGKFPTTDVFAHIEVADGRVWLKPDGIACFAGDLSEQEQKLVWATQGVPDADLFNQRMDGTAWRSKPSWYIVAKNDRTVHPDLERFVAKRMGATTYEVDSSHVPMLSKPKLVLDVIRAAASAPLLSRRHVGSLRKAASPFVWRPIFA